MWTRLAVLPLFLTGCAASLPPSPHFVHVESDVPIAIEEGSKGETPAPLCASPCNEVIDSSAHPVVAVSEPGNPARGELLLSDQPGDVVVKVTPGHPWVSKLSIPIILGGVAGVASGIMVTADAQTGGPAAADGAKTVSTAAERTGIITLAIGGAVLVGGIILAVKGAPGVHVSHADSGQVAARKPRYWAGEF